MAKFQVKGRDVSLGKREFIAQGGEGSVFVKGKTAFKIYLDPKCMIPTGKIQDLSVLTHPSIIKPEEIVFQKGQEVGYTMRYVDKTHPLCQTFTKAFRTRENLTDAMMLDLVRQLQLIVKHNHDNGILIVDLNEMNWLVSEDFKDVFQIDVDSCQTPHYPATALMESVRDRHSPKGEFNQGTDWFAFACVSYQMFRGIHPYKGKHPTLKGFDARMEANVPAFHPDVKVPKAVLPHDIIPQVYRDWYKAVLQDGYRGAPPFDMSVTVNTVIVTNVITGTDNFETKIVHDHGCAILFFTIKSQSDIAVCDDKTLRVTCNGHKVSHPLGDTDLHAFGFVGPVPLMYRQKYDQAGEIVNLQTGKIQQTIFQAAEVMSYKGRMYLRADDSVFELQFVGGGLNPVATQQLVCNVLPNATKMFPGVIVQDLLGMCYVSVMPNSGECYQIKLSQVKGYKFIDARYDNGVLMVVGHKDGKYDRLIFSIQGTEITGFRSIEDVDYNGLNFIVLDNGLCVSINEEDQVEVFSKSNLGKTKLIEDPSVNGSNTLYTDGDRVFIRNNNEIIHLRMK